LPLPALVVSYWLLAFSVAARYLPFKGPDSYALIRPQNQSDSQSRTRIHDQMRVLDLPLHGFNNVRMFVRSHSTASGKTQIGLIFVTERDYISAVAASLPNHCVKVISAGS
jgi:hypothetical protein